MEDMPITKEIKGLLDDIERNPHLYCERCKHIIRKLNRTVNDRNRDVCRSLLALVEGYPIEAKKAFVEEVMKYAQV